MFHAWKQQHNQRTDSDAIEDTVVAEAIVLVGQFQPSQDSIAEGWGVRGIINDPVKVVGNHVYPDNNISNLR